MTYSSAAGFVVSEIAGSVGVPSGGTGLASVGGLVAGGVGAPGTRTGEVCVPGLVVTAIADGGGMLGTSLGEGCMTGVVLSAVVGGIVARGTAVDNEVCALGSTMGVWAQPRAGGPTKTAARKNTMTRGGH